MTTSRTLRAFTHDQKQRAHALLAARVAHMMGRKFEEGDWRHVYCAAKGIPHAGWSNLNIDITCGNLGVEHKMLCYRSNATLAEAFGTTLMHPSATRSIRVPALRASPNRAMRDILYQYAELIRARTERVRAQNKTRRPVDMRTGWLLWQESLREFLYFEEPMLPPNPDAFYAEWVERTASSSARKASRNLWIFEKATGRKRYSVTTSAGAKIQPYFDVPPPKDPNVYHFVVIGEHIALGQVRVWLTASTAHSLKRMAGSLDTDAVSAFVLKVIPSLSLPQSCASTPEDSAVPVVLQAAAYDALVAKLRGVSDEHCFQLLLDQLA